MLLSLTVDPRRVLLQACHGRPGHCEWAPVLRSQKLPNGLYSWGLEQGGRGGCLSMRSEQMTRIRMLRLSGKSSLLQALLWAGETHPDPFFSKGCSLATRAQDAPETRTGGLVPPSTSLGKI